MSKYFIFSNGEYSDYCVGDMYISEKDLPDDVWDKFIEMRVAERNAKLEEFKKLACERVGIDYKDAGATLSIYRTPEHTQYKKWRSSQPSDEEVFQKIYNLTPVSYTECWGGI